MSGLPAAPVAEAAILGAIMIGGSKVLSDARGVLQDGDMYDPRRQAVWDSMCRLDDVGIGIDVVTLSTDLESRGQLELAGGIEGLATLTVHATGHNIKSHCEIVRSRARVRNLVIVARSIGEEGMDDLEDEAAFIDAAEQRFLAVQSDGRTGGPQHVRLRMTSVFTAIKDRQKSGSQITGVASPWPGLDEFTAGLQPSDLVIIAARPSMGKTAFALNLASRAAMSTRSDSESIMRRAKQHGVTSDQAYLELLEVPYSDGGVRPRTPVLFFSLEMGEDQLIERVLCSEAKVDAQIVRTGGRLMESDFRDLIRSASDMSFCSDLYIDDASAPSIAELRSKGRAWAWQNCPLKDPDDPNGPRHGLIVVDYLQLATGTKKGQPREQEISEISQGLKAMAKELKIPIVALAQLNRNVDGRADHRPMLSDLRESGAIEQDADVIMFIYREERYLSPDASEDQRAAVEGKAEIIIGKQRNGPVGTVHLTFIKKHTRFENPTHEHHEY